MTLPALAPAAHALARAVLAAANDPADQVRIMLSLAEAATDTVFGALLRRAALVQLCRASAAYQPTSYEDARALRLLVCEALDAEIVRAGDAAEDQIYTALRGLRVAVTRDLQARGNPLPRLRQVTVPSLPASVLAYRLYGDATRAADLIARADPPHPLFMPRDEVVLER